MQFNNLISRMRIARAGRSASGTERRKRQASQSGRRGFTAIVFMILLIALFAQGILFSRLSSSEAKARGPRPSESQGDGVSLPGVRVQPAGSAVVNFRELAAREAARPKARGVAVPQVIHSPVTPPEVEAPVAERAVSTLKQEVINPSVPSPGPAASFIGMTDIPKVGTTTIVIPPDTTGAVGTTKILSTLNNNYVVQDKTTGALSAAVSMDTFWAATGAASPFDPRTIYDPYNDRWIVSAVSEAQLANSSILAGVSQTNDPAGSYFLFRIDYDSTDMNWADFPVMGFNKNWVAINVNNVLISGGGIPNKALVIDYPSLLTGVFNATLFSGTTPIAHPVSTYSPTENTLYVTTHLSSAAATYRLETITGTPAAPLYTTGLTKTRPGGGWVQPLNQILPQAAPLAGVSSCGATPCPIETQDAFIRSEPVFRNNNIYYAQTIGLPAGGLTHTAVQWTRVDTSANFVDGGRIDDPTATATNGGLWYAYASLAVNKFDEVVLGFTQFSSSQFPSAGYAFRSRIASAGTMGDPFIFKAGEDYYHKTFAGVRNRWGDYSKAQVDPSDDASLWTLQEYAMLRVGTDDGNTGTNSSRWGTWWAQLGLAPTAAPGTISGTVETVEGNGLGGVTIRLGGQANRTTISDSQGFYHFDNVETDNFYTVTPVLVNYRFSPAERSFSLVGNQTDAVFTAAADAIPRANAIDSNEYFVRQQYLDFLGREPEAGGFDYWTAQLNECGSDSNCLRQRRTAVSAAFYDAPEFQRTGSFIYRLYQGGLGRQLSFSEFAADRPQVVEGPNLEATKLAFATAFVQRPEFAQRYQANLSATSFVDALLASSNAAAGVDLSSYRTDLLARYNGGSSRNESRALVVKELGDNALLAQALFNRAFVLMEYFGYLHRDPDQGGYDFWLEVLNNRVPGNYRSMVCAFITSTEYQRRFSPVITRSNADCGP